MKQTQLNVPCHEKTNNVVSEQVRHQPICAVKEEED